MLNNKNQIEISIGDLVGILIKRFWIILISMFVFASVAYVYSKYYVVPLYRSEVMFLIDPTYSYGTDYNEQNYSDYQKLQIEGYSLSYAKQLSNTYMQILQTRNFRDKLNEEYTNLYKKNVSGSISISIMEDTELFKMIVISASADDAYNIARLLETVAPEHITEIIGSEKIRVTDNAVKSSYPINNNTRRNVVMGAFLGAVIVYAASFLLHILNNKVKDEDDLKKHYNIPILGGIIDFSSIKTNKNN